MSGGPSSSCVWSKRRSTARLSGSIDSTTIERLDGSYSSCTPLALRSSPVNICLAVRVLAIPACAAVLSFGSIS